MTREEWKALHGFDEEDMDRIEHLVNCGKWEKCTIVKITLANARKESIIK